MLRLIVLSICLLAISCGSDKSSDKESLSRGTKTNKGSRTVKYSAPAVNNLRQSSFTTNLALLMGLKAITNGAEHELIRIWFWNLDSANYVVTINDRGRSGSLELCSFRSTKEGDSIQISSHWSGLQPLSGWANFADTLRTCGIGKMPGYDENLKEAGSLTTMSYVQFEVANKTGYRYFEYLEPYYYRFVDSWSNRVDSFLAFLNKELGKQVYVSYPKLYVDPKAFVH